MVFQGENNEILELIEINSTNCFELKKQVESALLVLWFTTDNNQLIIDGVTYTFNTNQIVFLTEFHNVETKWIDELKLLRFNRAFFCIFDHDQDVGCKGLLFFGSSTVPSVDIPEKEVRRLKLFWETFTMEMEAKDDLQIQMLQMMLKRYLILCTRYYRDQNAEEKTDRSQYDIIREFNFLVETHFREKHTVAEYAELLNRSPKTLSNIFSKIGSKTPLQYINDRKMLEARRLLKYTDKSVKAIAYGLGYEDIQTFSRFFKKQEGVAPTEFKDS